MFDTHKNLAVAQSGLTVAPSPATSGTTLSISNAEAANFPDPQAAGNQAYNCTLCPAGVQPNPSNAEVVRVTAKGAADSGGTGNTQFTIVRAKEGSTARTVLVGDQFAMTETSKVFTDIETGLLGLMDYVVSGATIPAGASLTQTLAAGVAWITKQKITIPTDGGHLYTASKDTYVDVDNTGTVSYTAVTNGAASPALAGNSIRLAKVVTGASTVTSVQKGGVDSIGNFIYPNDPVHYGGWIFQGGLSYSSTDGHIFVVSTSLDLSGIIGVGDRMRMVNNGVVSYFIVHAITTSSITLYGGTTYSLSAGGITNSAYSHAKVPLGFNPDPAIWSELVTDTSAQTQNSPTTGTYYNMGTLKIDVPIGAWKLFFSVCMSSNQGTATNAGAQVGLSTANNSFSDSELVSACWGLQSPTIQTGKEKNIKVASKTTYYLVSTPIFSGQTNMSYRGDEGETIIRAVDGYL